MPDVLLLGSRLGIVELRSVDRLSGRLATRGVSNRLVCIAGGGGGPGVIECPGLGIWWRRPWTLRRLTSNMGLEEPELIHAIGLDMADIALGLAERWGCPYVLGVTDFPGPDSHLRSSRKWFRGLIVPCEDVVDALDRDFHVPGDWVDVIRPGAVPPEIEIAPAAVVHGSVPVVGTAIGGEGIEGLTTFFRAARRMLDEGRDIEFVVSWQSDDESGPRRLAEWLELEEHVTFVSPELGGEPFWRVLDVYCQAAPIPTVGSGLIQALVHGIPSISTDVPGSRSWLVPDESGLLVPPDDEAALAAAVLDLLSEPERAATLGQNGSQHIARLCNPDHEADLLAALYHRALEEPRIIPLTGSGRQVPN